MSRDDYRTMAKLNKELGLRSSYCAAMAACSDMLKCERDFFSFRMDSPNDCPYENEYGVE